MGDGVNYQLCPTERRVLRNGNKTGILTQESIFSDLSIDKSDSFLCHFQDTPLKPYVFDDIHLTTKTLFIA